MKHLLSIILIALASTVIAADYPTAKTETVCNLASSKQYPRHSEGDFVKLKDGRIMFVYSRYNGSSNHDDAPADLVAMYSSDNGKTWTEPETIITRPKGSLNVMSVSTLRLKDGRLALIYLDKHTRQDCRPCIRYSSDEGKTWSEPTKCITDQVGYYVMNNSRILQLDNGDLLIPVALHNLSTERFQRNAKMFCYISKDAGKTWVRSGEAANPDPKKIAFQEPGLIQLSDGRIMMYIRTDDGCQYVSYSSDGGMTWTKAEKTPFVSPLAPMTLQHIPGSNNILAVWTEDKAERNPLVIAVVNEKLEFLSKQILDKSIPDPKRWFCYSAILPLDNNRYLISYCAGLKMNWGLDTTKIVIVEMPE